MNIEIVEGPGNSAAIVSLSSGESVTAEGGAMIAIRGEVSMETTTQKKGSGSIKAGLKRLFASESFFLNHYTAGQGGGQVYLATTPPGDMKALQLSGVNLIAEGGSFVAKADTVNMNVGWQGMKSLFAGEGLFWLQLSGSGLVVLNSFGAIYSVDVDGEYIVDTGHIVAFEETLNFNISKAGTSWISSFLGGEGLVCRFKGKGRVWCQSHHPSAFGRLLGPLLRPR